MENQSWNLKPTQRLTWLTATLVLSLPLLVVAATAYSETGF